MLAEGTARLDAFMLENLAVVIDASESAWSYQDSILQTAAQLIEKLPASMGKKLYFLGNPAEYAANGLCGNAAAWWKENSRRPSFISPVAESIGDAKVVVIGSGQIYDVEDLQTSPSADRMLFVNLGEQSLRGESQLGKEVRQPSMPELLRLLYDPITSVTISGRGFMPYSWDNDEYSLVTGDAIALHASQVKDPGIRLSFWGTGAHAVVEWGANKRSIPLRPEQVTIQENWKNLSQKEADVFERAVRGEGYTCPVCGGTHSPAELRCYRRGAILGETVYPSFGNKKGIVLLRRTGGQAQYRHHTVNALKLGEHRVAIVRGDVAHIWQYDKERERWKEGDVLKQYYQCGDRFVLII